MLGPPDRRLALLHSSAHHAPVPYGVHAQVLLALPGNSHCMPCWTVRIEAGALAHAAARVGLHSAQACRQAP